MLHDLTYRLTAFNENVEYYHSMCLIINLLQYNDLKSRR